MRKPPHQKALLALFSLALAFKHAVAGDPAAGKLKVDQQCAQCHRPSDFNGETTRALELLIKEINEGKIPHAKKAIQLSSDEIANIAAYWTRPQKKH